MYRDGGGAGGPSAGVWRRRVSSAAAAGCHRPPPRRCPRWRGGPNPPPPPRCRVPAGSPPADYKLEACARRFLLLFFLLVVCPPLMLDAGGGGCPISGGGIAASTRLWPVTHIVRTANGRCRAPRRCRTPAVAEGLAGGWLAGWLAGVRPPPSLRSIQPAVAVVPTLTEGGARVLLDSWRCLLRNVRVSHVWKVLAAGRRRWVRRCA